jgi:hypothetical protein
MYFTIQEIRKLKSGLHLFNQLLLDTDTNDPKEIAEMYRFLFNAVYGIMPEQARFVITRLG